MRDAYTRYPRTILWLVPGGALTMGGDDATSVREVEVEPFYISKTPVTNEQFEAYDPGFVRSPMASDDGDPAIGLRFADAAGYCRWYADVARKPMRLPTDLEWQYACRGGLDAAAFDDEVFNAQVWHLGALERSVEGGAADLKVPSLTAKKANGFGLYGMLGGVWEWTADEALRGGSFLTPAAEISCSKRRVETPGSAVADAGFRVAKSLR